MLSQVIMIGIVFIFFSAVNCYKLSVWKNTLINRSRFIRVNSMALSANDAIISPFDTHGRAETIKDCATLSLSSENIEKVLNEMRPYLIEDGGNVRLDGVEGTVVKLELEGACVGCPSSAQTLKMGLERRLKQKIPDITEVVRILPASPVISIENIESELNKIRPIIAVTGGNIEIVSLADPSEDSNPPFPTLVLKIVSTSLAMQAVKFEVVQRLIKYFDGGIIVKWE